MKSRRVTCIIAMMLFAVALPFSVAAQDHGTQDRGPKHHHYKVVDLGTFGGPGSTVSGETHTLTARGGVAGGADTPDANPNPGCFNPFLGPDCSVQHAFQWRNGTLNDLGTLPGGINSFPYGINANGWVIGGSENGTFDSVLGIPEFDAVVWRNGQITNLGTLGGNESLATDLNNRGRIVGFTANAVPDPFSMAGFATQTRPFLWEDGVMRDLDTLGGTDGMAFLMNERGQIIGQYYVKSTLTIDPMLWDEDGVAADLGTLGGTNGTTWWVNNRGEVVGTSNLAGDATHHGFVWDRGTLTDVGTLGGTNSEAFFINDGKEVVGRADVPGSQTHHGFLWKDGVMTDLGVIDGDACSSGNAINSQGQIVGDAGVCFVGGRAWLWEESGPMADLNDLALPGSGLHLQDARLINDRGEIVCTGVLPNGDQHAVLLIPVDGDDDNANGRTVAAQKPTPRDVPNGTQRRSQPRWTNRYHLPGLTIGPTN
jgi:probable HAF family extracellular repeat protein